MHKKSIIRINEPIKDIEYKDRLSSYGIIKNEKAQIAIVEHYNWGYIFPGGKIEPNEEPNETIKRESLEEIGYEVKDLKYFDTIESYYEVTSSKHIGKTGIYCHNIADIYTGTIGEKIQEPIEKDTELHWFFPNELFGKMKLDFQNTILENIFK